MRGHGALLGQHAAGMVDHGVPVEPDPSNNRPKLPRTPSKPPWTLTTPAPTLQNPSGVSLQPWQPIRRPRHHRSMPHPLTLAP